jgi:hypothetical protein
MVKKMLETPCGYGCDFGTKLVSVGKRMPVIFKNKSKPGKLNHSNFLNVRLKFFCNDGTFSSPARGKVTLWKVWIFVRYFFSSGSVSRCTNGTDAQDVS